MSSHVAITGASSGIGEALARAFAAAGHRTTLLARRVERLQQIAAELPDSGSARCDLSQLDDCTEWVEEAEAARGPVDVLVNNAGIQLVDSVLSIPADEADRLMIVDLLAPMRLVRRLAPGMVERGSGAIVNVASLVAVTPLPDMAHYNAAKSGLGVYSEDLRRELKPAGVHVMTVYPGPIATPMEAAAREIFEATLLARLAPVGSASTLANKIVRGVARKRGRLIYPGIYTPVWWFPRLARWVTRLASPRMKERQA